MKVVKFFRKNMSKKKKIALTQNQFTAKSLILSCWDTFIRLEMSRIHKLTKIKFQSIDLGIILPPLLVTLKRSTLDLQCPTSNNHVIYVHLHRLFQY